MGGLLKWVGNILFFLVFITVAQNLLPGKNYSRYLRLSAGMILILLVLEPAAEGFHLEEQMNRYFESFTFQQDAKELSKEILGIERERLNQVMDSYEQAVAGDVNEMAEEAGLVPVRIEAKIERDRSSENYGSVVFIEMEVKSGEQEESGAEGDKGGAVQAVNPVEPVTVTVKGEGRENSVQEKGLEEELLPREGTLDQLRRKVAEYYGLETGKVEIKFQDR